MELNVSGLTKRFGAVQAVDGVSCVMGPGVYGLLGVNGAGKTTLMRMLTTLLSPSAGEILWDGQDIFAMGERYRKILGYLPQDFGFYPDFTVQDYLGYIASIKGLRPLAARQRIQTLLGQVGMTAMRQKKMKTLSGGMKRRVGIAQAMLNDPQILILDEPTAGLDPSERIRFRNLISELAENRVVLLSTHIVSDVESVAGEIFLMKGGRITASGTPEDIIASMTEGVWSVIVPRSEVDAFTARCKVVSVRNRTDGAELRVLSDAKPAENATPREPTLEDAFLHYFGERTGSTDAAL